MPKVNFFLVGAAKAGTTSVARFLEEVPGTYFSPIKEPCHFCPDINAESRKEFERQNLVDLDRYLAGGMNESLHMHQVEQPNQYSQLFEVAGDAVVIGECSTSYLPSKEAAKRIFEYNPQAKIMAVLRNPVARIRSHYLMDQRIGLERRPLEDCLKEELDLGEAANFSNCRMYLAQSDYRDQIARFKSFFPSDQILVLRFEDVVADQKMWLPHVLAFLDLPPDSVSLVLPRENSADVMPRFKWLDGLLYRTGLKSKLRYHLPRLLPGPIKRTVKSVYIGSAEREKAALSEEWRDMEAVKRLVLEYEMM
ncbi:sulfotransferase [Celeribacter halophilus]|uniref:sulfotransferase family protein n=1 Tax=Celeribacter halophilus TaxID=576117 RepID=UPI002FCFC1DF